MECLNTVLARCESTLHLQYLLCHRGCAITGWDGMVILNIDKFYHGMRQRAQPVYQTNGLQSVGLGSFSTQSVGLQTNSIHMVRRELSSASKEGLVET